MTVAVTPAVVVLEDLWYILKALKIAHIMCLLLIHHFVARMRMVVRGEETRNSLVLLAEGRLQVITMIWIIEVSDMFAIYVCRTGEQILGTGSCWRLNLIWWHVIYVCP
jgi:hypothetical protein